MSEKENFTPPSLLSLFLSFLRLGATSFGGPAMIAYIRKMAVEEKKWISEETFRTGLALCQTVPGATAMQTTAYVGLKIRGIAGALASFTGFALPAFLIMMILSGLYQISHNLPAVISGFNGLQVTVIAIIGSATFSIGKTYLKNWKDVSLAVFAAILYGSGVNPFYVILSMALTGIIVYYREASEEIKSTSTEDRPSIRDFLMLLYLLALLFILLFFFHRRLFELAILMFRIDLFAFGGGFASLPLMLYEIVKLRSWMDETTFMNGIALGQVTPGPIIITSTFTGYILYGPIGGLIATISVFSPSFLIVTGIEPWFNSLRRSSWFNKAIKGILSSFVGLLLVTTLRFGLNIPWDLLRIIITLAAFISLMFKVDILWVVLAGGIISVFLL